jgi:hypothetical protein
VYGGDLGLVLEINSPCEVKWADFPDGDKRRRRERKGKERKKWYHLSRLFRRLLMHGAANGTTLPEFEENRNQT